MKINMTKEQYSMFLTYDYTNYEIRNKVYNQILRKHHKDLQPNLEAKNSLDLARSNDLDTKGICTMPRLDPHLCTYTKDKYFNDDFEGEKRSISQSILINDPILHKIFCSKRIIRPIQRYLGIFPSIQFIAAWENKGGDKPTRTNEMYWHMDHHGHKFVKVFYYLDDVKIGMGHHQFISYTHNQGRFDRKLEIMRPCSEYLKREIAKKRNLRGKFKMNDDAIWPIYNDIVNVVGEVGTGFAEDTRGLHRGTPLPPKTHRRMLQCVYVPFDNGKDLRLSQKLTKETYSFIQEKNNYSSIEMHKLFSLIDH